MPAPATSSAKPAKAPKPATTNGQVSLPRPSPIRPLGSRVVIEIEIRAKQLDGILLPENLQRPHDRGFVVAVGPKCKGYLSVGDYVMLPRLAGENIQRDGKSYAIIQEADIPAKQEIGVIND